MSESPDGAAGSDISLDTAIYQITSQRWKVFLQTQAGLWPKPSGGGAGGEKKEEHREGAGQGLETS